MTRNAINPIKTYSNLLSVANPNGIGPKNPPTATPVFASFGAERKEPIIINANPSKISKIPIGRMYSFIYKIKLLLTLYHMEQ